MALYVNTNVSSLNGQRMLTNATNSLNTTYQRLSSGLRINSAKDDAAGLQISDRLTSQINGLNQGNRNANDGIALAQTAEGAMEEMTNMLQRIRTLSLQSANGTNTQADRDSLQKEILSLSQELTRVSVKTTFNGEQILAGKDSGSTLLDSKGNMNFQVGAYAYDTLAVDLSDGFSVTQMSVSVYDDWSERRQFAVVADDDPRIDGMTDGDILTAGFITETMAQNLVKGSSNQATTLTDPANSIFEKEDGSPVDDMDQISAAAATTDPDPVVYISGAGVQELMISASETDTATTNTVCSTARTFLKEMFGMQIKPLDPPVLANATTLTTDTIQPNIIFDVTSFSSAQSTLKFVDEYLMVIDAKRADLGAIQNRMESTIRNQSSIAENTTDARSRIRDTDFALETANLSAQTILQQSSQTVLTQANQRPQIALALLGGQ